MRTVIATVCFGGVEYFTLAEIMFESLAKVGSTAERVCIGDREYPFNPALGVTCVVLTKSPSMKASAMGSLGLKSGNYGMLVDSDMVFTKNPDFLFCGDKVRVSTTAVPLASTSFSFNRMYFTEDESRSIPFSKPCINTGLMVFPGAIAGWFSKAWGDFHGQSIGDDDGDYVTVCDQPALEVLLWRGVLKAEYLPTTLMHFPAGTKNQPHADSICLHFTGYARNQEGKRRIAEDMRKAV
jgi:hypothetical protein